MKSRFDDEHLKSDYGKEYMGTSFPLKQEIKDLFLRYGYKNYELAYLCSFASKNEIDSFFPRYERLYNLMTTAARLKCPMLFKSETPTYIDDETRKILLTCLSDRVKKEFGKYSSQNYGLFRRCVFERAREVGWNPFELIHLVETELAAANGSDIYCNYDAVHPDDIKQAAERTIKYVMEKYETIEISNSFTTETVVNKDGETVGYILTPTAPYGMVNDNYVRYPFYGSLEVADELLYKECCSVLSEPEILLPDLKNVVLPNLNRAFSHHVSSNPLSLMIAQYRCIFDPENDYRANGYYKKLCDYYDSLSFLDLGQPSTYVAAQYLYSVLTGTAVCETLPIKVGAFICELLNLYGYYSVKSLDVISEKDKYDAVKRFFKLDKSTGLYERLA